MRRTVLTFILLFCACSRPEVPVANAPVILVSIDTLRADRVRPDLTPNLEALRRDAVQFTNAYAHVPLTLPSHATILSGLLPPENGVRDNIGFTFDAAAHPTIPSLLKARGYATGAAVSAFVLRRETGLAAPFDFYDDEIPIRSGEAAGGIQREGSATADIAARWIASQNGKPFFFMLHLFEPHTPYAQTYDGDVAAADAILGRFFDELKRTGVYDRAVIVVLSDHGEGLGDHGEAEHGIFLYREAIQVPLLLKLPKSERGGTSIDAPVGLIDVLPTIAALTGFEVPPAGKGTSLLTPPPARAIFSETLYPRLHLGWSELRSLVDAKFHYIEAPRAELYAASDVREQQNILERERRAAAAMRQALAPFSRDIPSAGTADPEAAKKLASLGYLTSTPSAADGPLPDPKDEIATLSTPQTIEAARARVARSPRSADAWTMLGRLLERRGQLEESAAAYRQGIAAAPSAAGEYGLALANVYLRLNRPREAAEHARLGLAVNPGNAHLLLGRAALAEGDLETATREAEQSLATFNYRVPALVLLAQVDVKRRRLDDALAKIAQARQELAAKQQETPPLLHFVHGDILARMNRAPEAIAAFEEEIRLFPDERQAYASLAVVHFLSGNRRAAEATMKRMIAANPGSEQFAAETFAQLGVR
ncbi:MAG TPA: sulfatase-like hydrolase/transferase [Thermoanaerobaculia bacterium]|jgi:tetratricopeptide (TPR) repeat protein